MINKECGVGARMVVWSDALLLDQEEIGSSPGLKQHIANFLIISAFNKLIAGRRRFGKLFIGGYGELRQP